MICGEFKGFSRCEGKDIVQINFLKNGTKVVIAVRTTPGDAQGKINFGVRLDFN
ncbi:MAG: hypothetical protein BWX60_00322 [Candidatus Marinimicrobia bacterium ADurb.Bin030]|nr:MAG: hypothetical protein BWX60_00322 [Candidatus Marinimicrobia bacterium ADurb.Bin030]